MAHVALSTLHKMAKEGLVNGLLPQLCQNYPVFTCSSCAQFSQKNTHYPRFPSRVHPGQRLHIDMCGPIKPTSRQGYRYFSTYLNEDSRCCTVTGLTAKSPVGQSTKKAILRSTSHFNRTITEVPPDNAGEYYSRDMDAFYKRHGICTKPPYFIPLKRTVKQNALIIDL